MLALARNKFALLAAAALLVTAGLFLHWVWRSRQAEDGAQDVLAALHDAGWRAEAGAISAAGAPNRIDLSIPALAIESPDGVWSLETPLLRTRATAYRRDYLALFAPEPLILATPVGAAEVNAPETATSLIFEGDRLARLSLDAPAPEIAPETGAPLTLGRAQLHLRADPASEDYKVYAWLNGLPGGLDLVLDGVAGFAAGLGRAPLSAGPPTRLGLDPGVTFAWPDATLAITGALETERGGFRGLLGFETDQARLVIDRLEALDLLPAAAAARLRERVSDAGRLAGALAVEPGRLTVRDVAPADIPVWPAAR